MRDFDMWSVDVMTEKARRNTARENGYLYAPADYWILAKRDPEEMAYIAQGCGPHGWLDRIVPDKIAGLKITPACKIHDFMYYMGETETDREQADRVFLNNMFRMISVHTRSRWLKWYRRRKALQYYHAVKYLGAVFFWDGKNKPENLGDEWEVVA